MSVAAAICDRDVGELPSKRDEDWRWTDLRGLIRQLPEPSPESDAALPPSPFGVDWTGLEVVNGFAHGGDHYETAFAEETVALRFIAASPDTSHTSALRIVVTENSRLTVLESYEHLASGYLASTTIEFVVEPGAELERIVLCDDDAEAVSVSEATVELAAGASFSQTILTSGARRQRMETRVAHAGGEAELRLDGVYLLADKRHADLTTVVTHEGVDGATSQLTKGVVRDQARGIFQGRIIVAEGADRTDARMGHHALILSDRAEVDAKPELEIYADDVSCAHGNTVGALDEDALFYARQRGIPEEAARAMLTAAFVGEVIDRIGHEGAREVARAWAAERLA